jgi:hypothetical protein
MRIICILLAGLFAMEIAQGERRMLIAHLKARLVSGEIVDLLPVRHETDVKKEVSGLLDGWAKSGFLIWEKFIYPWHQVQTIEVTVESLSNAESAQRMVDLHGSDRARLHEEFWKGSRQI